MAESSESVNNATGMIFGDGARPEFNDCTFEVHAGNKELGEKQKQSKKVSGPAAPFNVYVNVHQHQGPMEIIDNSGRRPIVTANKYVGPKAHVQLSESNTSATVANGYQGSSVGIANSDPLVNWNSGHIVTANKYVGPKAQVTLSETNISATVTSSGVPTNQN